MTQHKQAEWVFDALPPSGARRGGNPAEHAFKHDLGTFVREVVQNANDQAQASPRIVFRLCRLRGERLIQFLTALDFASLRRHLDAAAQTTGGASLRPTLGGIDERGELLVMYVEDYGTEGLTGDESEGESHFRALCKDTLFSHKREASAGGSYGLGKSVLWIFSGLSTVLFDSTLVECPRGLVNPRFIGRAELPSHDLGSGEQRRSYAGPGWLGARQRAQNGERAESLWGQTARGHATGLGFGAREDHEIGTSICIVGFRDPTADEEPSLERLLDRTEGAIVEYFWPAMQLRMRRLRAEVGIDAALRQVSAERSTIAPFLEAWQARESGRSALEQPGDVVVKSLDFRVPPTHDGAQGVLGKVDLIVRLESERAPRPRAGQVAVFRGPGMVVKYWDRSRIALGMRPFHAILACGLSRHPASPAPADAAVEQFLRLAEPPSHDDWTTTQRLKETYKRGYARALEDLKATVDDALRSLLVLGPTAGRRGPERLERRFPIGTKGPLDKRQSAFHIQQLSAFADASGWSFSGVIEPTRPGFAWSAVLRASEVDERGGRSGALSVLSLEVEGEASVELDGGIATLNAAADARRISFRGRTGQSLCAGALELEVAGQQHDGGAP